MNISPNQKKIALLIFVIIIIFVLFKTSEGFVTNTEAINNISSLYNASNLTATNISATGYVKSSGAKQVNMAGDGFTWLPHPDGNNYIRGDQTYISGNTNINGNTNIASNLTVGGYVKSSGATQVNMAGDGFTWLPHPDGNNYIRGDQTYISGNTSIIGNTNIDSNLGVGGVINAGGGVIPPTFVDNSTPQGWDAYGNAGVAKFKISDPVGTIKKIIFLNGGYEVTFIKDTATTIRGASQGGWHGSPLNRTISNP